MVWIPDDRPRNQQSVSQGNSYDSPTQTWYLTQPVVADFGFTNQFGTWIDKTSVKTPNYKALRKAGTLPVNPYSVRKDYYSESLGSHNIIQEYFGHPQFSSLKVSGAIGSGNVRSMDVMSVVGDSFPGGVSNLVDKVNTTLLTKSKDMKTNILQVYAERQQTIDLVASTAKKLGSAMSLLLSKQYSQAGFVLGIPGLRAHRKKGRLRYTTYFDYTSGTRKKVRVPADEGFYAAHGMTSSVQKVWAKEWLALQYGWKPLLQDIYGVCEELANRKNEFPADRKIRAKQSLSSSESVHSGIFDGATRIADVEEIYSSTLTVTGGFTITAGNEQKLAKLGLTNPALLGWELLPYSFVVDWFLPVGTWLNNLDAAWFQSAKNGFIGVKREYTYTKTVRYNSLMYINGYGGRTTHSGGWTASKKVTTYERTAITQFPTPSFPKPKNPLSMVHLLNALSLFVTKK